MVQVDELHDMLQILEHEVQLLSDLHEEIQIHEEDELVEVEVVLRCDKIDDLIRILETVVQEH